jgi:ERCC4-type nuclease
MSRSDQLAQMVRAQVLGMSIEWTPGMFGIAIDTREQRPWKWHASVPYTGATLAAGDYAPIGCESSIAIERKSLSDLWGSVTRDNARFQRELSKLAKYKYAAVVIEGAQAAILRGNRYSQIDGSRVLSTCATLETKFGVPFHFAGDRANAAIWALHLLESAWRRAEVK